MRRAVARLCLAARQARAPSGAAPLLGAQPPRSCRRLATEVGEMAGLYRAASRERAPRAQQPGAARAPRLSAAERVECSEVLAMATAHLDSLGGTVDCLDGRWFFDVLHALKEGTYHSPASRSDEMRALLRAAVASLQQHPNAWQTHELSAAAAALVGFSRRGLLPGQQRRFLAHDGDAAAVLRALAGVFETRLRQAGPVQVTNMLWSLARAELADQPLFGRVAAWIAAAEARDDYLDALRAQPPGAAAAPGGHDVLEARLADACGEADAAGAPYPPALFGRTEAERRPVWAASADGDQTLAPRYASVLRGPECRVQHATLLLWACSRGLSSSSATPADARRRRVYAWRSGSDAPLLAACSAILRRLLALAAHSALFSPWHVSAISEAVCQMSRCLDSESTPLAPSVAPLRGGGGGDSAAAVSPPHTSRRAVWAAVAATTGAQAALDAHMAACLDVPTAPAAAAAAGEQQRVAGVVAARSSGGRLAGGSTAGPPLHQPPRRHVEKDVSEQQQEQLQLQEEQQMELSLLMDPWEAIAAEELESAELAQPAGGAAAAPGAAQPQQRLRYGNLKPVGGEQHALLSHGGLALQPLAGVLDVAWACVASWALVLLPLLQPQQLATIADGLSFAAALSRAPAPGAAAGEPAAAGDGWHCAFPRTAVLHALLHRANALLRERGRANSGADGTQFASLFRPSEVAVVASAVLRFRRALAATAEAPPAADDHAPAVAAAGGTGQQPGRHQQHLFQPWLLEDSVPLGHLGHALVPSRPAGGWRGTAAALARPDAGARSSAALPLPSRSPALDAALAAECSTLLTLAGDVSFASLHAAHNLRLPTASSLIAASVGLAGTANASAHPHGFGGVPLHGIPRGPLSSLMAHTLKRLVAGSSAEPTAGEGAPPPGRGDSEEPAPVPLDQQLDALWALTAATAGPRPATMAEKPSMQLSAAQQASRTATVVTVAALCERHARNDMALRQLATLAAAAACCAEPLPAAAAAVLLSAAHARLCADLDLAAGGARCDAQALVTLAWAAPYVMARVGGIGAVAGAPGAPLQLLLALREALEQLAGDGRHPLRPNPGSALCAHQEILAATIEAASPRHGEGANAPSSSSPLLPVAALPPPSRLKAVLAAHAAWASAIKKAR